MQTLVEKEAQETEQHSFGTPWIQITFTLDAARYKLLRDTAEDARLTVPSFVRDVVEDALRKIARKDSVVLAVTE